jgi:hypothetical protein
VLNLDCSGGGSFDFVSELQGSSTLLDLSWHISDHFPLWVEFAVPGPERLPSAGTDEQALAASLTAARGLM